MLTLLNKFKAFYNWKTRVTACWPWFVTYSPSLIESTLNLVKIIYQILSVKSSGQVYIFAKS